MIDRVELRKLNGWMDPAGKISSCGPQAHLKLAKELCDDPVYLRRGIPDDGLLKSGWIKTHITGETLHIFHGDSAKITKKQKKALSGIAVDHELKRVYINDNKYCTPLYVKYLDEH